MSASDMQNHLQDLQTERALASIGGLAGNSAYMADLDHEIAATHSAYVGAAVTEIATLRARLSGLRSGKEKTMAPRFWTITIGDRTLTVAAGTA